MYRFRNCRPLWALVILAGLLQSSFAATKTFTGNAHDVRQITTITVAGTWLDTETATMTINGKDIVVTLVGAEATTAVATGLKNAWMAATRLDGSGTPDVTSNAGGQEFGEFSEVTATVSGSVVTLTANTAGRPFTVTVAETSATGTLTPATPQAATGKEFWDNADNWDTVTVPANDDVVRLIYPNLHIRYGLPNNSLEFTFQHYHSANGEIGLPPINITNPSKPYKEYRQAYVRKDDAGTGTNIADRFGIGQAGTGSTLINVKQSTLKGSPIVYNTGQPLASRPGTYALNLCYTANTSTVKVLNGSVDISSQDGGTSAFVSVVVDKGNVRAIDALDTSAIVSINGGYLLLGGTGAITTVKLFGGNARIENQIGTISDMEIQGGGVVEYISTATISELDINSGTFDASINAGAFTITNANLYQGTRFLDPHQRITASNPFAIFFDPSPDLIFGSVPGDGATITP